MSLPDLHHEHDPDRFRPASRGDLQFLLYELLDIEGMCERPRFADHARRTVDEILEVAERIATDRFAPHNREADANEPHLDGNGRVLLFAEAKAAFDASARRGCSGSGSMSRSVGSGFLRS